MPPSTEKILAATDKTKHKRQEKQADFNQKRKRTHGFAAQMRGEILQQRTKGTTYETNNFLNRLVNSGHRRNNV